jgi:hypothetical protein
MEELNHYLHCRVELKKLMNEVNTARRDHKMDGREIKRRNA